MCARISRQTERINKKLHSFLIRLLSKCSAASGKQDLVAVVSFLISNLNPAKVFFWDIIIFVVFRKNESLCRLPSSLVAYLM